MTPLRNTGIVAFFVLVAACDRSHAQSGGEPEGPAPQTELHLRVDGTGYHPSSLHAPAGEPVRLRVTRVSDDGCGQQLVFPTLRLQRDLPLNTEVTIDLTMPASGSLAFTCGMDMMRGSIVAQ